MPPPATLLQSHDTSYMLKRGWASEKSSQPTSCIHLHTFITLHKLVPQKTFDSLIAYLRLIPVYGSSWMYKIKKTHLWSSLFPNTQLHFGLNLLPLFGLFSAQIIIEDAVEAMLIPVPSNNDLTPPCDVFSKIHNG